MEENQNIEWKESWRDEYIKWIGGFANASGGKLYIGINDKGEVSGLVDANKLLEDIPNKVRDVLGIIVDVDLKSTINNLNYLEIRVESYPYPVSYKGQYHYRTGSTKQELKGATLDKFLLQKQGRRWDGVPVPNVSYKDLSKVAFEYFRNNAIKSNRLTKDILQESNEVLLEKLHLTDGKYLKRATLLLFHPDPEKFVTGSFVKIGYFRTDDDLIFQDEIHGCLFEQVEKTMDLLLTKYLKATITYEGLHRLEKILFPEVALREALLNAIAHKDYSGGVPIQISVYSDKIIFWNDGTLPENWTIEELKRKHASRPFNPDISNTFFRSGLIESWGRGTIKIINECIKYSIPAPIFNYDFASFSVEMKSSVNAIDETQKPITLTNVLLSENQQKIISLINANSSITRADLSKTIGISEKSIYTNIKKLKDTGILRRIGSDKFGSWEVMLR